MIVHMIGNAHIDPVWLWRWQEGVDAALAAVSTQVLAVTSSRRARRAYGCLMDGAGS